MTIKKFFKIIFSKILYIILIPIIVAGIVFFVTRNIPPKFQTSSLINSGIASNAGLSVEGFKVDNVTIQSEYGNLLSMLKATSFYEEISLHLLTQHLLLDKPNKSILSEESYEELQKNVPDRIKKLIVKGNFEASYQNLKSSIVEVETNYIYRLMNYGHKYYSIQAISNLKAERITNSDLVKISYESVDPGICFNTVKFAVEIFFERYGELKLSQSNSAVAYFEKKLREIQGKLDAAEQKMLDFNIQNDIINYYEQTEQVTTQQEKIEIALQETKMQYEASVAVLEKLENEVEQRYNINLSNSQILKLREQLVNYNNAITKIEFDGNLSNKDILNELKRKLNGVEMKLEGKIDSLNIFQSKSQGIEVQKILLEWLDAVKANESYLAQYKSMRVRQAEFMKQFQRYAPLGATLKRYEREIDVYEREYLNTLHHLGLALQKEQNANLRTKMQILDEAKFPINAILPPRKIYMIAAALFSVIFYLLAIFIIELLDKRIKYPSTLSKLSSLETISAFCLNIKGIDTDLINEKGAINIYEKIRLLKSNNEKPFVIQILSHWDNSGKKYIADKMYNIISENSQSVLLLNYILGAQEAQTDNNNLGFNEKNAEILKYNSYSDLVNHEKIEREYLICIHPPLSNGVVNPHLLNTADATLLVFDANTTWTDSDKFLLSKLNRTVNENLFAVLSKSIPDNLEEMYGEIPKKRSFIRKYLNKMLKRVL